VPNKISVAICHLKPAPLLLCTHDSLPENTAGCATSIPGQGKIPVGVITNTNDEIKR
jgi:hypothetical protein